MVEVNVVFVVKWEIMKGKKKGDNSQNIVNKLELSSIQERDNQDIAKGIIVYSQGKGVPSEAKGKYTMQDHQKEVVMIQAKQATQKNTYWQTTILPTNPPQLVETMVVT